MYFDFVRQPFPHPQTELLFTFESSLEMNDISQLFVSFFQFKYIEHGL